MPVKSFMKVEKADHSWIIDVFHSHFSRGLSKICDSDFLKARYDAFRDKEDPIYLELLDGMKDEPLSRTFVSYWTTAHTLATQSRFWIENAIAEVLIRVAQKNEKNDLRIYSQSMLGDGWIDRGVSVVDIGEEQLEHLSDRRPWRVSMQRHILETVDVIVGEQERERVNREGFLKRQWEKVIDPEVLGKDRKCMERVAASLIGPPVSEAKMPVNFLESEVAQ